jgi:hypothetical protein
MLPGSPLLDVHGLAGVLALDEGNHVLVGSRLLVKKVDPNMTPTRTRSERVELVVLTIRFGAKVEETR